MFFVKVSGLVINRDDLFKNQPIERSLLVITLVLDKVLLVLTTEETSDYTAG